MEIYLHGETVNAAVVGVEMLFNPCTLKSFNSILKMQPRMMVTGFSATPAQQSSPATVLPMLVMKRTSTPFITSYPPLFLAYLYTTFSSSEET